MRRSSRRCLMLKHTPCCPAAPPPQMSVTPSALPQQRCHVCSLTTCWFPSFLFFQATATEDVAESLSPDDGECPPLDFHVLRLELRG